ncbi:MAG: MoaD/ThiS family protein, partial [Acidobacteriota bacterium]
DADRPRAGSGWYDRGMEITVFAFATAGDLIGHDGVAVELPDGARISTLRAHLVERHPELDTQWPRLAVAIEGTLVAREDDPELADGQEVALLPPVSGGRPGDVR